MDSKHTRTAVIVLVTSCVAVFLVFALATSSIFTIFLLKNVFGFVISVIATISEVFVAFVAAITSGATVCLSVILASLGSAVTFPASAIQSRICVAVSMAATCIASAAMAMATFANVRVDPEVAVAVVTAAAFSVAFASAWAVGVMSLIERETNQAGLKMGSIIDAVRHNQYFVLRVLLKINMGVKQQDIDLAFVYSVKAGFYECADVLLGAGASPERKDAYDNTPLQLACETGCARIVTMLLRAGASVHTRNSSRATALHHAAKWGYSECVQLLIDHGADPNAQDALWRSPMMLAGRHAPRDCHAIQILLKAGANVNMVGADLRRVIHYAALRCLDIALLVEAGADPRVKDADGNSPLHISAMEGHVSIVSYLLGLGIDTNCTNVVLQTPVHLSAIRGHVNCVEQLVASGANINFQDRLGKLPIWHSVTNKHIHMVVYLLKQNCYLESYCGEDSVWCNVSNPLDVALDKLNLSIARVLVIAGCPTTLLADKLIQISERVHDNRLRAELKWLITYITNAPSLNMLCRNVIRKTIGPQLGDVIDLLPLPTAIKGYIQLWELRDDGEEISSETETFVEADTWDNL